MVSPPRRSALIFPITDRVLRTASSPRKSSIITRGGCCGRRFAAQNLIHDRPARRTFAFDSLPSILGGHFHCIVDLFLRFALDAVSFGHRKIRWRVLHAPAVTGNTLGGALD